MVSDFVCEKSLHRRYFRCLSSVNIRIFCVCELTHVFVLDVNRFKGLTVEERVLCLSTIDREISEIIRDEFCKRQR